MLAENVQVSVEAENDRSILLVLDRFTDCILIPWQDAYALAGAIDKAVRDAMDEGDIIDPARLIREQEQVRLNAYHGQVAVIFDHADRVRFTWRSAMMVRDALRIKAQEVQYAFQQLEKCRIGLPRGVKKLLKQM